MSQRTENIVEKGVAAIRAQFGRDFSRTVIMLGSGSGLLGGLFGVGGAVITTPILTSVFGTSQVVAQGLSLALAAPSTGVTLATYALHDHVQWALAIPLAIGGLLSISWGVRLAHALPERMLRVLFTAFLLICALMLGLKT